MNIPTPGSDDNLPNAFASLYLSLTPHTGSTNAIKIQSGVSQQTQGNNNNNKNNNK